jgi:hypothetical protein
MGTKQDRGLRNKRIAGFGGSLTGVKSDYARKVLSLQEKSARIAAVSVF